MSTPPSILESDLNFIFEIELISNKNTKFLVELKVENYSDLIISAKKIDNSIFQKVFINSFTPDKIKENKYFLHFDNLKEICDEITEKLKNEKISLNENSKSLTISIPLNSTKIKEINFELYEKEINTTDKFDKILSLIEAQNKEINELKQKNINIENILNENIIIINQQKSQINELKEKNKELVNLFNENKNLINQQKLQINNLEEKINKLENSNTNYGNYGNDIIENLDSIIIKDNIQYKKYLKNWISPNKKIKAKLLYRLTKDGNLASEFHKKCDNKGTTLILFDLIDGNKIGFYIPLKWTTGHEWKNDMNSFIFNLTKNKKHKKLKKCFQYIVIQLLALVLVI